MHSEALKESRIDANRSPDLLYPTGLLDLSTKGPPENPQKYFQKVTFLEAEKRPPKSPQKNHQLITFHHKNHPKKRRKAPTPL
jgi:hypothetical protein